MYQVDPTPRAQYLRLATYMLAMCVYSRLNFIPGKRGTLFIRGQ